MDVFFLAMTQRCGAAAATRLLRWLLPLPLRDAQRRCSPFPTRPACGHGDRGHRSWPRVLGSWPWGGCAVDGHRDAERSGGCTRVTAHGHGARETTAHQAAVTRASAPSCVLPPTWSQTLGLSARLPASRARDKEGRATVHEHTQRDPKRRARFWWADPMVIAVNALGMTQITAWGTSYYCLGVLAKPIVAETGWGCPRSCSASASRSS